MKRQDSENIKETPNEDEGIINNNKERLEIIEEKIKNNEIEIGKLRKSYVSKNIGFETSEIICKGCGSKMPADSVFCEKCGRKLDEEQAERRGQINALNTELKAKNNDTQKRINYLQNEINSLKKEKKKIEYINFTNTEEGKKQLKKKKKIVIAFSTIVALALIIGFVVLPIIRKVQVRTKEDAVKQIATSVNNNDKKMGKVIFPKKLRKDGIKWLEDMDVDIYGCYSYDSSAIKEIVINDAGSKIVIPALDNYFDSNGYEDINDFYLFHITINYENGEKEKTYIIGYEIKDRWYMLPGVYEAYVSELYFNYKTAEFIGELSGCVLSNKSVCDSVETEYFSVKDFYNGSLPEAYNNRMIEILGSYPELSNKWDDYNLSISVENKKCELSINDISVYPVLEEKDIYYPKIDNDEFDRIIKNVDLSAVSIENYDIPELAYLKAFDDLDVNVSWAVTPSIYADEILVSTRNYDMGLDDAAYIYTDGKWGFIDYNGEYIVEPKYSRTESYLELYTLRNDSGSISLGCDENGNLIVNDYGMDPGYGGLSTEYFYFENMKTTVQTLDGMGGEVYKDERPVSVRKGNILGDSNITAESELYGMAGNRGLLVDIAYDDVYMFSGNNFNYFPYDSVTPGYAAFEKDGKWAYFKTDGSRMTDFSYDGFAQDKVISMAEVFWGGYDSSKPYLPTEGYIAVKSDGKCGYIDTNGEVVIPLGTFDDVRPVHNGKAWVKFGDYWGVIQLPERSDELILPEEEDYIEYNKLYDVINAYEEHDFESDYVTNHTGYKFIYVNDDDIPELVVISGETFHMGVYSCINGNIEELVYGSYISYKPNTGELLEELIGGWDTYYYKYSFDGINITEKTEYMVESNSRDGEVVYHYVENGQDYTISDGEFNDYFSGYEDFGGSYSSLIEAWVNAGK